ncbi:hypothetical protein NKH60_33465, partial [Mesorhizobium sp. M1006]|uniref:hypothetical protein n=1 Tax=Mesorhizobium sp. M1006 TaxID=2957048 RepID=UPI0033378A7E
EHPWLPPKDSLESDLLSLGNPKSPHDLSPILLCEDTNTIRAVMNPRCPLSKRSLPMQAVLWSGPRNETISASSVLEFCMILLPEPIGATLASQLTRRTCVR